MATALFHHHHPSSLLAPSPPNSPAPKSTQQPQAHKRLKPQLPNEARRRFSLQAQAAELGRRSWGQLLSKGFAVRAGALDLDKARSNFPNDPNVDIVRADVTEGPEKLAQAIGDAEAVVCATGFRFSWDVFAPWKDTLYEAPYLGIK